MSEYEEPFRLAKEKVMLLNREPTNDEKSILYGLYKQATIGDVNIAKPYFFDMIGRAKWDAWNTNNGKTLDDAKQEYIAYVNSLFNI